jgi:hypothetical protein
MAYGLGNRAPIADASFERNRERRPAEPWQELSETCRLALVERALAPRSPFPDGLPAAL